MESIDERAAAGLGMLIIVFAVIGLLVGVFMIICQWLIFAKAKQPGWAVLIPIYSLVVLLKIVGRPVSWIAWFLQPILFVILMVVAPGIITGILYFLSIITVLVFAIIVTNGLSKGFGKDAGFTVGLIVLGFIFYPILAFGKAQYIGPGGVPQTAEETLS